MLTKKETTYLSKLLSLVLHHEPARLMRPLRRPPYSTTALPGST